MTMPVLTAAEMRSAEQRTIDSGASVEQLMERAGAAIAEAVWRIAGASEILILCGPGNNGGDGYVAARMLKERGAAVRIACAASPATEPARAAAAAWDGGTEPLARARPAPVLVDALFGTGLARRLDAEVADALQRLCDAAQRRIAVDLPSGVSTDDGRLLGAVPQFDLTVALGALKVAHLLLPSADRCGRVSVAEIGVPVENPRTCRIGRPRLSVPPHDSNKYSRGKLVIAGGAMPGASRLAALAGQRSGPGYVELLDTGSDALPQSIVQRPWSDKALADDRVKAVVVGPGLGLDRSARDRLDAVLASGKPLVLDADALTLVGRTRHDRLAGHVITPHWGEFVRLFGDDGADRLTQARRAAAESGAIIVLKGSDSIVARPDGRAAIAALAPSWLASAGTGDVLSGIVGGLLAAGRTPFDVARDAIWLHSQAARLAGPMLIADDLIAQLPVAIESCL